MMKKKDKNSHTKRPALRSKPTLKARVAAWLRRLLYVVAFLLLFIWVALSLFDAQRAKDPIASWLSHHLGAPISIGRLVFNPLHPYTLLAEQVQYGQSISFDKLYLEIEQINWLTRDISIAYLDLIGARVTLPLPAQRPTLPLRSLTIANSTITNLSVHSDTVTLRGVNATLSDWLVFDPLLQPTATLQLKINQIESALTTLSQLSLSGNVKGETIEQGRFATNLFEGRLQSNLALNWPQRTLQLTNLHAQNMRVELDSLSVDSLPLQQITLDWGELHEISLTSIKKGLSLNNFNGQLSRFNWQAGNLPTAQLTGRLAEVGHGLLLLEDLEGKLALSSQQIDAELTGEAYEGRFNLDLSVEPAKKKLTLKEMRLRDMDISLPQGWWQEWQSWQPQQLDIRTLSADNIQLLSFDDRTPLSLTNWQLNLTDLILNKGQAPRPLFNRARVASSWKELVWDGLQSKDGDLAVDLTPNSWQLTSLRSAFPGDGNLKMSGQWSIKPGHPYRLDITGQRLDLERWGKLVNQPLLLAGVVDISATLTAIKQDDPTLWRNTLQGEISLDAVEPFWERVTIDPLLDHFFSQATAPTLSTSELWQAMQGGDTPFGGVTLHATLNQGTLTIRHGNATTITHQLALQGGVDLRNNQWQLDMAVLNKEQCAELISQWRGPLKQPTIEWHFPKSGDQCHWKLMLAYPPLGGDSPLWRFSPNKLTPLTPQTK